MNRDQREIVFDKALQVEAYRFYGIMQRFPNHFHDYYVFGFVEKGRRRLNCKNREYIIDAGDVVIFNPRENHSCYQINEEPLDWRCINVKEAVMEKTVKEIYGGAFLPVFNATVVYRDALAGRLRDFHGLLFEGDTSFKKEELFYFLIEELAADYAGEQNNSLDEPSREIQAACLYMEENYSGPVTLDDLCQASGLKKYTLLRHFVRQRGTTPYQYLETIRVGEAKKRLEKGISPIDAALQSGFSDQSHFTRFFKNYIGLTPKQYQKIFED